jgi:hypothetical protein
VQSSSDCQNGHALCRYIHHRFGFDNQRPGSPLARRSPHLDDALVGHGNVWLITITASAAAFALLHSTCSS